MEGKCNPTAIRLRDNGLSSDELCDLVKEYTTLTEKVQEGEKKRVLQKKWFNKFPSRKISKILDEWINDYPNECREFIKQFNRAVEQVHRNC